LACGESIIGIYIFQGRPLWLHFNDVPFGSKELKRKAARLVESYPDYRVAWQGFGLEDAAAFL
jgi:hypothetical protein